MIRSTSVCRWREAFFYSHFNCAAMWRCYLSIHLNPSQFALEMVNAVLAKTRCDVWLNTDNSNVCVRVHGEQRSNSTRIDCWTEASAENFLHSQLTHRHTHALLSLLRFFPLLHRLTTQTELSLFYACDSSLPFDIRWSRNVHSLFLPPSHTSTCPLFAVFVHRWMNEGGGKSERNV